MSFAAAQSSCRPLDTMHPTGESLQLFFERHSARASCSASLSAACAKSDSPGVSIGLRRQFCAEKYRFLIFGNRASVRAFRSDTRGVRVVTNVERNAVDAMALTDERRLLRTVKSCGPDAPRSGAKLAFDAFASWPATVANGMVRRGERGVSRKPSRREGRSVSACTCGQRAFAQFLCAGAVGACGHPVFPVPSCFERATIK